MLCLAFISAAPKWHNVLVIAGLTKVKPMDVFELYCLIISEISVASIQNSLQSIPTMSYFHQPNGG